eukprot:1389870-Rhodomonas_salina.1
MGTCGEGGEDGPVQKGRRMDQSRRCHASPCLRSPRTTTAHPPPPSHPAAIHTGKDEGRAKVGAQMHRKRERERGRER